MASPADLARAVAVHASRRPGEDIFLELPGGMNSWVKRGK